MAQPSDDRAQVASASGRCTPSAVRPAFPRSSSEREVASGSATKNARFPGQWFMLESGLHYNWHRYYDPTTGRYTTPDPLGFVDGPSVYAYAGGSPLEFVDPDGRFVFVAYFGPTVGAALADLATAAAATWRWNNSDAGTSSPMAKYGNKGGGKKKGIYAKAPYCPPSQPPSPDECDEIRNNVCIPTCTDLAVDHPGSDFGRLFQRCVNQCMYDLGCGGVDYGKKGWSSGNPGAITPWR